MNLINKKENTFSASVYYRNEHTVYIMAITSKQIVILLNLIIMNKRTSTKNESIRLCLFFDPAPITFIILKHTPVAHTRKTHLQH